MILVQAGHMSMRAAMLKAPKQLHYGVRAMLQDGRKFHSEVYFHVEVIVVLDFDLGCELYIFLVVLVIITSCMF